MGLVIEPGRALARRNRPNTVRKLNPSRRNISAMNRTSMASVWITVFLRPFRLSDVHRFTWLSDVPVRCSCQTGAWQRCPHSYQALTIRKSTHAGRWSFEPLSNHLVSTKQVLAWHRHQCQDAVSNSAAAAWHASRLPESKACLAPARRPWSC